MCQKNAMTHTHTHLLTAQWKMRWALLETTQNGGNTQQAHVQFDTNIYEQRLPTNLCVADFTACLAANITSSAPKE